MDSIINSTRSTQSDGKIKRIRNDEERYRKAYYVRDNKKVIQSPQMHIVRLRHKATLLAGSDGVTEPGSAREYRGTDWDE